MINLQVWRTRHYGSMFLRHHHDVHPEHHRGHHLRHDGWHLLCQVHEAHQQGGHDCVQQAGANLYERWGPLPPDQSGRPETEPPVNTNIKY